MNWRRLQQLEELGKERGAGIRWKIRLDGRKRSPTPYMAGWCNGSAGMAFLWTLAHQVYKERHLLELAEKAATNAWESSEQAPTLCCGTAGSAYAFLALHRAVGDRLWLTRSDEMLERAIRHASSEWTAVCIKEIWAWHCSQRKSSIQLGRRCRCSSRNAGAIRDKSSSSNEIVLI